MRLLNKLLKNIIIKSILVLIIVIGISLCFYIPTNEAYKAVLTSSSNNLIIHYIDVGQGDAILIQKNNINILIDTGPEASKGKLISYLKKYRIKKIDALIITHPHEDHIGGAATVIKKVKVCSVYSSKAFTTTPTYYDFIDNINKKNLKIKYLKAGDTLNISSISFDILCPFKENYDNLNDYSLIMNTTYGNYNLLFTGDMEKAEENEFINYYKNWDKKKTILKVPHHGSSTTCSDDFLSLTKPSVSIISCGIGNSFGHPHKKTLERLNKYKSITLRTDIDGSIILICDGNSIKEVENN